MANISDLDFSKCEVSAISTKNGVYYKTEGERYIGSSRDGTSIFFEEEKESKIFEILEYIFLPIIVLVDILNVRYLNGGSCARFHGAEHMIVNALEDLKRYPTVKEVKKYSMIHEMCGSNETQEKLVIYLTMLVSGVISLIAGFHLSGIIDYLNYTGNIEGISLKLFVVAIITLCYIISLLVTNKIADILLKQKKAKCLLQKLFVINPTDYEIRIALKGLRNWLKNNKV